MHLLIIILLIGFALFLGFIYFIPTLIAINRNHHNRNAIFALNLLLGWSFIGWAISLTWSLTQVYPRNQPLKATLIHH